MSLRILSRTIGPISTGKLYKTCFTSFTSCTSCTSFQVSIRAQITSLRFQSKIIKASKVSEEIRQKLSSEEPSAKIYNYQDIKALTINPNSEKILIDVREPNEYKQISIPNSINIPYKSTPGALDLSPEEFKDIFKFEKPSIDKELIFYCVSGIRSTAAADLAKIFGYKKLGNYVGSLKDWLQHEQPILKKSNATNKFEKKD